MAAVRLDTAVEQALLRAARAYPATPFNLNYAEPDGQALASCLFDLLVRADWAPLSPINPAAGFARRGVILWAPPARRGIADALAAALDGVFAVQVVERDDGGPVALTVGVAT